MAVAAAAVAKARQMKMLMKAFIMALVRGVGSERKRCRLGDPNEIACKGRSQTQAWLRLKLSSESRGGGSCAERE
jgi:hypothetical protein